MRILLLTTIAALMLLGACTTTQTFLTTDEKLAKADQLYGARKYARAAELYGEVYFERVSASSPYALLRQADCLFRINKFSEARIAYQEFISTYSTHQDLNTAYFRTALCLFEESLPAQYDQTETQHAIDAFKKFIEKYPNDARYSEALDYIRQAQYKLLEKKYLNGYIYYKMKDYSSALMYFKEITDLGNSDSLDRQSLYYTALLFHKQKLGDKAQEAYNSLVARYPGSKESKKLARLFK